MWWGSVYWLSQSATHCWLALLSHVLCHLLYWAWGDDVAGRSGIFISEQWLLRLDAGLCALVIVMQCIMGALRMTASAKLIAARNSSVARAPCTDGVEVCVGVFFGQANCLWIQMLFWLFKSIRVLNYSKREGWRKVRIRLLNNWFVQIELDKCKFLSFDLREVCFVPFQYPDIWCPCARIAAWGKQGFPHAAVWVIVGS